MDPTVLNLYVALMRQDFSWLVRTRRCREITTIEVSYFAIGDPMHAMNLYLYGIGLRERPQSERKQRMRDAFQIYNVSGCGTSRTVKDGLSGCLDMRLLLFLCKYLMILNAGTFTVE